MSNDSDHDQIFSAFAKLERVQAQAKRNADLRDAIRAICTVESEIMAIAPATVAGSFALLEYVAYSLETDESLDEAASAIRRSVLFLRKRLT